MSRARLFAENMIVYGLGGMLAKLVPFVMLPVVTRLMPGTEYFGLSDLTGTVVTFAQAVAIMGMYDAMFRMFFEREDESYKREICSTALFFVTGTSLIVAVCLLVLADPISRVFFGSSAYSSLVVVAAVSTFVGGNNSIVQAPTRMQNKRIVFIVMNLVTAVLSYAISVPMLLAGEYLLALPVAAALASLTALAVFAALNRKWFSPRLFRPAHLRVLLAIGLPLMPNFISYWVFNSCDRIMIVNMLGAGAAGVYAIASKVGHLSQLIYTAFAQGWQYFAFSTMRDEDQVELTSRIYEYLGAVSFLATGLLMVIAEPLFALMFPGDYSGGVVCAPYLFLAPLLLMLFQVQSNQLLVVKTTWPMLFMLALGVAVNVVGNLLLIPVFGIEGASMATLAGYAATNAVTLAALTKLDLMAVRARFFTALGVFVAYFLVWRLLLMGSQLLEVACFLAFAAVLAAMYRAELKSGVARLRGVITKRGCGADEDEGKADDPDA